MIVPHAPLYIRTLEDSIWVTSKIVTTECQARCGVIPVQVRPNPSRLGKYSTSWIIHFKQKPANCKFRLFDKCGPAIPFVCQRPMEQCQRCWGFHNIQSCTKGERWGRCNVVHETDEFQFKVPKCANCAGPHKWTNLKCMARLRR